MEAWWITDNFRKDKCFFNPIITGKIGKLDLWDSNNSTKLKDQ